MIRKEDIENIYGLSPMQNGMLIHHAMDPTSSAYLEQFDFKLRGHVSATCMERALVQISQAHDILRTVYSYKKTDLPRQIVLKQRHPQLTQMDIRHEPCIESAVESFKELDRSKGFDLSRDILVRAALIRVGEEEWQLLLTFHHILMDGWSLAPFFTELFRYYEAIVQEERLPLAKAKHQYHEYIRWLQNQSADDARNYWRSYVADYERPSSLPDLGSSGYAGPYLYATHAFQLPSHLVADMERIAKERQLTVNTLFQCAWGILLQKYNHVRDVVFGTVVSGRPPGLPGVESMIGLFINTRPQRVRTEEGDSFASICSKMQRTAFESIPFEYYPLYEIQSLSELKNQLLDHVIAFENYPLMDQLKEASGESESSLSVEDVQVYERANYDFSIIVNPGTAFSVKFVYNEGRFSPALIAGIERSLITLLEAAVKQPDSSIDDLSLCSPVDQTQILHYSIGNHFAYPSNMTVDSCFKETASKNSQDIALIWRNERYTFEQLDRWSDRLAARMRAQGFGPGTYVGLLVSRCPEMVAGMLGIVKTGAVYIPLDANSSAERIALLIEDTDIKTVCTLKAFSSRVPTNRDTLLLDDPEAEEACHGHSDTYPLSTSHHAESPFYIMYTSGSTGKPKGCIITHRNILRLVFSSDFINFGPGKVMLQTCSPTFDPSVFEIWVALLRGGTLVVADEEDVIDADRLGELLRRTGVTTTQLVTALFNRLCDQDPAVFATLQGMMVGGDVLNAKYVKMVKAHNPEITLVNGYGPTENTTISTIHIVNEQDLDSKRISVGRPVDHSSAYIVDQGLHLLPIGAIGELCVGGDGVGAGYYNRDELTKQKFVQNPFEPGGRMYRTGDLARWLPDGTIDFLGRADSQVKYRGYRIEIGEIERNIMCLPGIQEVVVQVQEISQEKQLCAYYTAEGKPDVNVWRKTLASKLPDYMIPVFFTQLDELPLTPNYKIDRKALPKPTYTEAVHTPRMQPSNAIERTLTEIFTQVLGVEHIALNYNFYELGVNSLNIITIANRIKAKLNREIPLTILFEHTSIIRLAEYLQLEETEYSSDSETEVQMEVSRNLLLQTDRLIRSIGDDNS